MAHTQARPRRVFFRPALTLLSLWPACAAGADYHATRLLPDGYIESHATGIADGRAVGYGIFSADNQDHAFLWSPQSSPPALELPPIPDGVGTFAAATDGTTQLGSSGGHAVLWTASSPNPLDLHPGGYTGSSGTAMSGGQQVGYAYLDFGPQSHAMVWNGTPASAVDLHPAWADNQTSSFATGTNGLQQVGYSFESFGEHGSIYRALLWNGTAESLRDITSPDSRGAIANAIDGANIVGASVGITGVPHATLWTDTAHGPIIDLNPTNLPGITDSSAAAISGTRIVGNGSGPASNGWAHALFWTGLSSEAFDLHTLLPPTFTTSFATAIDTHGNIVGEGFDQSTGRWTALLWTPTTPEPSLILLPSLIPLLSRRHRPRTSRFPQTKHRPQKPLSESALICVIRG